MAKGRVEIMTETCKSCRYCIAACPRGVLGTTEAVNSKGYQYAVPVNAESCIGCGICATMCPDAAISVWREEE